MRSSTPFVAAGFMIVSLYSASAADYPRYHTSDKPVPARTKFQRHARFVAGCHENFFQPVILQCPDNTVLVEDADAEYSIPLRVIPQQRRKPYPSLFSWSYGGH